jgi:Winged helix DNA-binding domain
VTERELNRATLARQLLLARETVPVADAVDRLGGLQAQEPRPPFVALWSRLEGFEREQLHAALRKGTVVRAMLMRATLHLVSAKRYARLRPALDDVMTRAMTGALRGRDDGLDLEALLPAATKLLRDEPRTFNELRALLSERFPKVNERALGYAVRTQLPLVMEPSDDAWAFPRDARFALPKIRLGKPNLEDVVLDYLAAFGPATVADVQRWSGLQGLKPVLEALREELVTFKVGRRELYDLPDAPRPGAEVEAPPRFLPDFDSLVLAHDDRTRVIADEHKPKIASKNLRIPAMVLWDGFVAGTWRVERKRGVATLSVTPFAKLPRGAAKALEPEALALLAFAEPDAKSHAFELA